MHFSKLQKGTQRGILLVNLGSPSSPSIPDIRRFIKPFLQDRRVVRLPFLLWRPLLHLIVLPLRLSRVRQRYLAIWKKEGSPLRHYTGALALCLEKEAQTRGEALLVDFAMTYSESDSIPQKIESMLQRGVEDLTVLPLFPQFSSTTTQPVLDRVLPAWESLSEKGLSEKGEESQKPTLTLIQSYAHERAYINALLQQIQSFQAHLPKTPFRFLISFHSLPKRYVTREGDPYERECELTYRRLRELLHTTLSFPLSCFRLCYQSRFGGGRWLTPSLKEEVVTAARARLPLVVFSPGFACDCAETLFDIEKEMRALYETTLPKEKSGELSPRGGEAPTPAFFYIPALNDSAEHAKMLLEVAQSY